MLILDKLNEMAQNFPDNTAARYEKCSMSYKDFDNLTSVVANNLIEKIGKNNRVILRIAHDINALIIMYA